MPKYRVEYALTAKFDCPDYSPVIEADSHASAIFLAGMKDGLIESIAKPWSNVRVISCKEIKSHETITFSTSSSDSE